jgi:hypothetical protein
MLETIVYSCCAAAMTAFVVAAVCERRGRRRYQSFQSVKSAESSEQDDGVYDPQEAAELFLQIQRDMAQTFGFTLTTPISAKLSSSREIHRKLGVPAQNFYLGMFGVEDGKPSIYVATGLPRPLFYAVLAHEYAHVWQRMEGMCPRDFEKYEGFAEWVALVLTEKAGLDASELFDRASWDPYGTGMRRFAAYQELYGTRATAELAMRGGSRFRLMRGDYKHWNRFHSGSKTH